MNTRDFLRLGVSLGEATRRATDFVAQYFLRRGDTAKLENQGKAIVANPFWPTQGRIGITRQC